jgi:hypothetical protein
MRNRNLYISKIESVEGKLKALQMMVKMNQPANEFIKVAHEAEEILQDVKDMFNREPVAPNEL